MPWWPSVGSTGGHKTFYAVVSLKTGDVCAHLVGGEVDEGSS